MDSDINHHNKCGLPGAELPIGVPAQNKQPHQQPPAVAGKAASKKKKKCEISKDELKNGDFDQIVMEASALITRNLRALKLVKIELPSQSAACGGSHPQDDSFHAASVSSSSDVRLDTANQPKRPMNAFMVWGQAIRRELHNKFSNVQNAVLSKALGRVWKKLDLAEKEPYITRANIIKSNHKRDYPNYRYQPRRIQEKQRKLQQGAAAVASTTTITNNNKSTSTPAAIANNHINTNIGANSIGINSNNHVNNHYLKQQQLNQLSRRVVSPIARTVTLKPSRPANVAVPAPHFYEELAGDQTSAAFVPQCNEDNHWKANASYAWPAVGETDYRLEPAAGPNKHFTNDDKYFHYADHRGDHYESEYQLPPIESGMNTNSNTNNIQISHMGDIQNRVSVGTHAHPRLFYEAPSSGHLKRADAMMGQPVASNLPLDGQYQNQNQLLIDQEANSLNIYNSNYRQQYQPHELEQELIQQIHQNQLDSNNLGQYRQQCSEQARYPAMQIRYHNTDSHNNPHSYLRQINDISHSTSYTAYRAQHEDTQICRGPTDEICPV